METVTEVLNKSHFSLQMGNCPIPIAEHSGQCLLSYLQNGPLVFNSLCLLKKIYKMAPQPVTPCTGFYQNIKWPLPYDSLCNLNAIYKMVPLPIVGL